MAYRTLSVPRSLSGSRDKPEIFLLVRKSLGHTLPGMKQHILKYEFHFSKVLKFIEIY